MSITSIGSLTSTTSTASTSASTSSSSLSSLTANDFLKLLLQELQNQLPTDPVDMGTMTQELAALTQVETSEKTNTYLQELDQYASSQAVNYLGKTISFSNNDITVSAGTAGTLNYTLGSDASDVSLKVYDSSGDLVNTIDLGKLSAGSHSYTWDCTNSSGATVSDGTYTAKLSATDAGGNNVSVTTGGTASVTGIAYTDGVPYLITDQGNIAITSVTQVS